MTDEQVEHVWGAIAKFQTLAKAKYAAGAEQHGGNLWDHDEMWLIDQALLECADQWMYLITLRDKIIARRTVTITLEEDGTPIQKTSPGKSS